MGLYYSGGGFISLSMKELSSRTTEHRAIDHPGGIVYEGF